MSGCAEAKRREKKPGVVYKLVGVVFPSTPRYALKGQVSKQGEVWRVRDVEVVLDRTPIGLYFEIEGPMDIIRSVAESLGMNVENGIRQTYAELYRQHRRTRADLPENMVFPPDQLPAVKE